ncbi:MAG: hypothetical protein KDD89_00770 [Anaerolineales bacterium]|nr:hypothetical protein [Anaerolineales bacterium]
MPPWLDDLAALFVYVFGLHVVMLSAALLVGAILYSASIMTIFVIRSRD